MSLKKVENISKESNRPSGIPSAWENVKLDDLIFKIDAGKSPKSLGRPAANGEFGVLKVSAVSWGEFKHEENKALLPDFHIDANYIVKSGDLLISRANTVDLVGAVVLVNKDYPNLVLSDKTLRLIPVKQGIAPKFLLYALRTRPVREHFEARATGTSDSMRNISQVKIRSAPIPLPPLNEQRRIVAKIEELTAHSKRAREALEDIPALIEQFKQSVLAAAFRGDLTADWREKNSDIEPASKLLERIWERRYDQATPSKLKKIKQIYDHLETEDSSTLPPNWSYVSLDKLADSFNYGTSQKSSKSGEIPVLRMGNLQGGEIDWKNLAYSSRSEEISKYNLEPNTVLFNRTNSPELVGKTSIYRGERSAIFAGYLIRINNFNELNSEYLNYCLNSEYATSYCWKVKTDGVSQSNINAQKLGKFEVPFCPIEEQREVVRLLDQYMGSIKLIEQQYWDNSSDLNKVDQSILSKAFRGELVPQDPNDEPADLLLERIRAEREKLTPKKKTKRPRKKKSTQQLTLEGSQ